MNYRTGIKNLLIFTAFILISFAFGTKAYASDYQYKILDPKYNPSAEKIMEGNIPPIEEIKLEKKHQGFDFGLFLAIFAAVTFPIFVISVAVKTFKEVTEDVPGRIKDKKELEELDAIKEKSKKPQKPKQIIGNVKIPQTSKSNMTNIQTHKSPQVTKNIENANITKPIPRNGNVTKSTTISPKTKQMLKRQTSKGNFASNYAASPVDKKNPMLLNTAPLTSNKGFCLVEYNQKYSLIGYIGNEIFLLNQFSSVNTSEIRSRLSESVDSKDRYIVRLGNYKALVEVSESKMNVLLEL